jgi:Secretion system C-terminal sorting domain
MAGVLFLLSSQALNGQTQQPLPPPPGGYQDYLRGPDIICSNSPLRFVFDYKEYFEEGNCRNYGNPRVDIYVTNISYDGTISTTLQSREFYNTANNTDIRDNVIRETYFVYPSNLNSGVVQIEFRVNYDCSYQGGIGCFPTNTCETKKIQLFKYLVVNKPGPLFSITQETGLTNTNCPGLVGTFKLNTPENFSNNLVSATWSISPNSGSFSTSTDNAQKTFTINNLNAATGTYVVSVNVSVINGFCSSTTFTKQITITNNLPTSTAINSNIVYTCRRSDSFVYFTTTGLSQYATSYEWEIDPSGTTPATIIEVFPEPYATTVGFNYFVPAEVSRRGQVRVRSKNTCGTSSWSPWLNYFALSCNDGGPRPKAAAELSVGEDEISFYPNPASTQVKTNFQDTETTGLIELVDESGRILKVSELSNGQATLDVSQLINGAYWVRYSGNKKPQIKRLLIQR